MFKNVFETVESRITVLASANLSAAAVQGWLGAWGPYLDTLVKFGQLAVAVATVIYIINKTLAVRRLKKDDE